MGGICFCQPPTVVTLSANVGSTVDAEENLIYKIFPKVTGFKSAQIFELKIDLYQVRIAYLKNGVLHTTKWNLSFDEFMELRHSVANQPAITDEMRRSIYEDLEYLRTSEIIKSIPTGQFVIVKHISGKKIRGILLPSEETQLNLQTTVNSFSIPFHEIDEIAFHSPSESKTKWNKWLYFAGASGGLALAEVWNNQKSPQSDLVWHYRFLGIMTGLLGGQELIEAINIITSPKNLFKLSPEDIKEFDEFE